MYALIFSVLRTGIFAESRFLGRLLDEWAADVQEFVRIKLPHLLFVAMMALALMRLLSLITGHMIRLAERHAAGSVRISQVRTLAGVVRTTGIAIILIIVNMVILQEFGVNLAPLLASAGVAGVAIGLAAQTIVKDVLNGTLILVENQFSVGDVVTVAGLTGTIETMTLRKTTIRGGDGTLYTVPNSQITTVANQSIDYSVATMNISVDFSADPNEVIAILTRVAQEVRNSPDFKDVFVAEPQVLGVDSIKGSQLVFPVIFKTSATKQYGPMREFQRKVRIALAEHHMLPGDPLRVFNSFSGGIEFQTATSGQHPEHQTPAAPGDPTTMKPQETNPFTSEA